MHAQEQAYSFIWCKNMSQRPVQVQENEPAPSARTQEISSLMFAESNKTEFCRRLFCTLVCWWMHAQEVYTTHVARSDHDTPMGSITRQASMKASDTSSHCVMRGRVGKILTVFGSQFCLGERHVMYKCTDSYEQNVMKGGQLCKLSGHRKFTL